MRNLYVKNIMFYAPTLLDTHTFSETSRPSDEYLPVNKAFIGSNDYPVPNECRFVVDWVSGNKFMWNLKQSTIIFKQEN